MCICTSHFETYPPVEKGLLAKDLNNSPKDARKRECEGSVRKGDECVVGGIGSMRKGGGYGDVVAIIGEQQKQLVLEGDGLVEHV